jgi:hypothetical protein
MKGEKERPTESGFNERLGRPSTAKSPVQGNLAMEHPTYGIDVGALTLAVLLAAEALMEMAARLEALAHEDHNDEQ